MLKLLRIWRGTRVGGEEGVGKTLHFCMRNGLVYTKQDIARFMCVIRMLGLMLSQETSGKQGMSRGYHNVDTFSRGEVA